MKTPEKFYPIWIETIAHQKFRNTDKWRESECMQFAQAYSNYVQEQSTEVCIYCKTNPMSDGSDSCGECIDNGNYIQE